MVDAILTDKYLDAGAAFARHIREVDMGRPRKAQVEGETFTVSAQQEALLPALKAAAVAEFDAQLVSDAAELERIVVYFKAAYPDKWEAMRLCSLHNGLEDIIACLRS